MSKAVIGLFFLFLYSSLNKYAIRKLMLYAIIGNDLRCVRIMDYEEIGERSHVHELRPESKTSQDGPQCYLMVIEHKDSSEAQCSRQEVHLTAPA